MSAQQRIDWMLECAANFEIAFSEFGSNSKITKRCFRRLQIALDMAMPFPRMEGHA
jgi:hypothetical protein